MTASATHYYSNGKLLLTGEYLIMYGANSLAIPLKYGQSMEVKPHVSGELRWEAFIRNRSWFTATIALPDLQLVETDDFQKAEHLLTILRNARQSNPEFLSDNIGYRVTTNLNYPQEWGLGSSSTFVTNLAQWANVDAMKLNSAVSNGSGYDVACAGAKSPILFQNSGKRASWQEIVYHPPFSGSLFFIFLGQKQISYESVAKFRSSYQFRLKDIEYISGLTEKFVKVGSLDEAISVIDLHEAYMSEILKLEPIKQRLFSDFRGSVKSLGAWGGDFVMVASPKSYEQVKAYFYEKGFETIFTFEELALSSSL